MKPEDVHPHLMARMRQRGVSLNELQHVLDFSWPATNTKYRTAGKVFIFPYQAEWEGQFYQEKEVTVYYKSQEKQMIVLTVIVRYLRVLVSDDTSIRQ